MQILIRSSLTKQEQSRVAAESSGSGKRSLIIGGAGKMGAWMANFLASQEYGVEIADPRASEGSYAHIADWRDSALDHDIIVVATPIKLSALILSGLAARRPGGLIFDIGSLKTPLKTALSELRERGCHVTSIHPMFGPDTQLLSGRHIIFIDVGERAAVSRARSLFSATMAELVEMSLEEHDKLIGYILGLSHALNLAFFTALAGSGELVPKLRGLSSTTFDAQLAIASRVAEDNPHLYFEIQALNQYGRAPLDALVGAAEQIRELIDTGDERGFVSLMEAGRKYLATEPTGDR
jgi:chorismate mutase/prephenate dehydrogenase